MKKVYNRMGHLIREEFSDGDILCYKYDKGVVVRRVFIPKV